MSQDSSGQRHDRTALIIYGSESGNAQDGAEQLGRITQRLRFATTVVAMDSIEIVGCLVSEYIITNKLTITSLE